MHLIEITNTDCEFTFKLCEQVERVEVRPDLTVTVVGPDGKSVTTEAEGYIKGLSLSGVEMYAKTAPAYLDAAERQGIPVVITLA